MSEFRKDPLKFSRPSSEAARQIVKWCGEAEVFFRGGNSSGKTASASRVCVALSRGLKELDGYPLPDCGVPNVGWVLTQSYKQQVDSSQKAYLHWIGDWPHHVAYVVGKGKGYIEIIYVATSLCKHGTGQQCDGCSRIVFHCEESKSAIGGRIDWAHADEPPLETTWREIRGRRQRGKPFVRIISATPLERERWAWMADEFRECTVYSSANVTGLTEQFGQPKNRRAEIRSTIYDNEFLTDDDLDSFEADFATDVFYLARIRGDYVDLAGKCPFNVNALQTVWLPRCQPPMVERLTVNAEINTESGRHVVPQPVEIETWEEIEKDETYFVVVDPSTGIADKKHDPGGIHVWARGAKKLVARYNGYCGAWGLGSLAAILGRRYNNAMVDVEMNAGYGSSTLLAMSAAKYYRIMKDKDADKPGTYNQKLGFRTSSANRGEMIGILQAAIVEDTLLIRSKAVIDCLLNITVDETGQVRSSKAKKGRFDEDMICAARAAYLFQMMPAPKPRSEKKKFMERVFGQRLRPEVTRERWA